MAITEGESVRPALSLADREHGADTTVTLLVTDPGGEQTGPITCVPGDGGATHTAAVPVLLAVPGLWTYTWSVTGTGQGTYHDVVSVAPAPAGAPGPGRVYATTEDYARWLSAAPPPGAARALWVASRRVDEMVACAIYDTDADGYPTDPELRQAMRLAACAQADYMRAIGDPYGRGALGTLSSVTIGSVSVSRAATGDGSFRPPRYSADAMEYLASAGLLGHGPITGW